jgi:putative MATE family efflux protein
MKDLTEGNEARLIFNFTIPMLLGNLFQQSYHIINTIIVGNFLGKEALAAVGASFPIIFTLISLIIGVSTGGTIVIAQYFGAKDYKSVKRACDTIFIFFIVASIILSVIGIVSAESLFRLIRLPEEIIPEATTYLIIYFAGMIVFFGFNGTSAMLRGMGDSTTPLYFLIISTIVNIGLDLLFILVFKWGIAGAALATVIAEGGAFLTLSLYLNRYHEVIKFNVLKFQFDNKIFRESLRIGLPTGVQQTFISLGMLALMGIVNTFGTDVIAAYTVAGRIDNLAVLPAMNFSAALATFVGQNLGAGKADRVRSGLRTTLIMSSSISLAVTIVGIVFRKQLIGIFTDDPEVIRIGSHYLLIVCSFYLPFTAMFKINGVLRGAGDTFIPMFISLISLWVVRIPLAWIFSHRIGETGIWWSIPAGWMIGLIMYYLYYATGNWRTKVVVKPIIIETEEL